MKTYIRMSLIKAKPMTREEYIDYRNLPTNTKSNIKDEGYFIETVSSRLPNDTRHEGYISWLPTEAFERIYKEVKGVPFEIAYDLMKKGYRISNPDLDKENKYLTYLEKQEELPKLIINTIITNNTLNIPNLVNSITYYLYCHDLNRTDWFIKDIM